MQDNMSQSSDLAGIEKPGWVKLGPRFRKLSVAERRVRLSDFLDMSEEALSATGFDSEMCDLADIMVESAVGYVPVPLGVAAGFRINQRVYNVPFAVEEPSVIAAATFAASIISLNGGFSTAVDETVMTAEVYVETKQDPTPEMTESLNIEVEEALIEPLAGMTERGGGYRGLDIDRIAPDTLAVRLHMDTCDAMGANILNTCAERVRPLIEMRLGGEAIMAILTNAADRRVTEARFSIPVDACARGGRSGFEVANRIVKANRIATIDVHRAVTHNKGIMNGISSVALATANDTRAIEAACHAYAARDGVYRALTEYSVSDGYLHGTLRVPLAVGTVGGAAGFHPAAQFSMQILERPNARTLAEIMACVGLAQNFAALSALVSEGIQAGHMRLHANRLAWKAGARGEEIAELAERLSDEGVFNSEAADRILALIRAQR
ncbi:MAG: hydroxymethylglutaryl-CoA reductase, degradative [Spirochaetota bacterium]